MMLIRFFRFEMTVTKKGRRLESPDDDGHVDYEELRVGNTALASIEDLDSLDTFTEVSHDHFLN